jgi:hypothetical protein
MFGSAAQKLAGTARKILQNPPTIMTQLRARRLCQSAVWQTACLRSDLASPAILPESGALAGEFNTLMSYWQVKREPQKLAGGIPCVGSDKISKAILPDACGRLRFAGCAKTLNLETRKSWKTNPQRFLRRPNGVHYRQVRELADNTTRRRIRGWG